MDSANQQLFAAGDTISLLNSRTPQLISIMTSLQDSFSSISQLADSVAMPDRESTDTSKDGTLRLGLERVRLMFLAEDDGVRIRAIWEGLETEEVVDEELAREVREMQERINHLPAVAPTSAEPA